MGDTIISREVGAYLRVGAQPSSAHFQNRLLVSCILQSGRAAVTVAAQVTVGRHLAQVKLLQILAAAEKQVHAFMSVVGNEKKFVSKI